MFSFALRRTDSEEEAQDAVMGALLSIAPHVVSVDPCKLLAYWRRSVLHILIREHRRRQVVEFRSIEADEEMAFERAEFGPQYVADDKPVYARIETEMLINAVRDSLPRISQDHREVLLRHYYVGQSVEEISAALGRPDGTVKSRLKRGRESLEKPIRERLSG
jgi:RNA polymerase sigma factor (sigma-70 family)